jgi:catechol 2,3-dioxygenase-like lactoylglutathione lyase family enzyme
MDLTLTHTFLIVHDQDAALTFYRDTLGFDVRNDVDLGGMRWLTVSPPQQPGIEIGLNAPFGDPEEQQAVLSLVAKGLAGTLIFVTTDVDKAFEELVAAGVEVTQEPIDQPYGVRDCSFRDPSGNHIRLSQRLDGGTAG